MDVDVDAGWCEVIFGVTVAIEEFDVKRDCLGV